MQVWSLLSQNRVPTALCEEENNEEALGSDDASSISFWGNIWKLRVSNKVRIFLWHAFSEALPTKLNLQKRKVLDNLSCSLCQTATESTLHALWGCEYLLPVWDIAFYGVRRDFPQLASFSDLVSITSQESRNLELFAMVAWSIWLRRNKLHCNEPSLPINKIFDFATALPLGFQ